MNLAKLENKLLVLSQDLGVAVYDFQFDLHFACSHPYQIDGEQLCVLRVGALDDYAAVYAEKLAQGLRLVNSPEENLLASELESWYPKISALTPRTKVFQTLPDADEIEVEFAWPIFMKGSRQTSKHNPDLAVIQNRAHYERAAKAYRMDAVLHWQKPVIREFVPLQPIAGNLACQLKPSLEYRSFWWFGECVGYGRYWYQLPIYDCEDVERGLAVAAQAARLLQVPFLVVDFAKTLDGRWIVIECNDGQESGYAAIAPQLLWRNILERLPTTA